MNMVEIEYSVNSAIDTNIELMQILPAIEIDRKVQYIAVKDIYNYLSTIQSNLVNIRNNI